MTVDISDGFKRNNSMEKAGTFVAQCGAVFTFCVEIETRVKSKRERVFIRNIRRTISFIFWKIVTTDKGVWEDPK